MRYFLFTVIAITALAHAEIKTGMIEYSVDTVQFKGFYAFDSTVQGDLPGVLVVHEWWGLNDFAREQAKKLAAMGYYAFAADMYGGGKSTKKREQASQWASEVRGNTKLLRKRVRAALQTLARQERVDSTKLAAIGFCFGGTTVLHLAFGGVPVEGVASFHGHLPIPSEKELKQTKASVLVLHGADDPSIKKADIDTFMAALKKSSVDWQLIFFGNAVHSFTNPKSGSDKSKGVAYNERAAKRSWRYLEVFLREIFRK
ncbi:MAG: dienelactone hydrolase family protein [Chitinivibrionales bacterium]|nr:dienelactone hydrolase family protein [Chitinivibrionales bacterium]